jgi:hypothetical protein
VAALQRRACAEVRPAVVTLPAEVDVCNTRRIGLELGAALAAATVIADKDRDGGGRRAGGLSL